MPFKRILIAVDFSSDSVEGFRIALEMRPGPSPSLHLLHVIEARPAVTVDVANEIVQEANAAIDRLVASCGSVPAATDLTTEIASGEPSHEILNRAREWGADLIVLGAKGTASLESIILGGTAEHVMQGAPCSVLLARRRSS
ncbi:MAG TPA: universal stress protein [Candidatus Binatia bacterium]